MPDGRRAEPVALAGDDSLMAQRLAVRLPTSPPYRYVPHHCWRCGGERDNADFAKVRELPDEPYDGSLPFRSR